MARMEYKESAGDTQVTKEQILGRIHAIDDEIERLKRERRELSDKLDRYRSQIIGLTEEQRYRQEIAAPVANNED